MFLQNLTNIETQPNKHDPTQPNRYFQKQLTKHIETRLTNMFQNNLTNMSHHNLTNKIITSDKPVATQADKHVFQNSKSF